jgi:hypothetical protein
MYTPPGERYLVMKDRHSRPFTVVPRPTVNKYEHCSPVRHPPVGANGLKIGDSLPPVSPLFKAWCVICSDDRLGKLGVMLCEGCTGAQKPCMCPAVTLDQARHRPHRLYEVAR